MGGPTRGVLEPTHRVVDHPNRFHFAFAENIESPHQSATEFMLGKIDFLTHGVPETIIPR
jgi:hypothetical protein